MDWTSVYERVSRETGIPENVVREAYRTFWRFIRETISGLPLKEDLTEEQFNGLRTNFNVPSLGKLVCTYDRYIGMKKRYRYLMELRRRNAKYQESTATVYKDSDHM